MRNDREWLLDILEAIQKIEQYHILGRNRFDEDELIQTWMIHHLQIIGEAAGQLKEDFIQTHPIIPWSQIIAMRNLLVHVYFGVDLNEVWRAVEKDLPVLRDAIEKLV
jgi:uncharacterized protein with HEPN domain